MSAAKVLVVDDDPFVRELIQETLPLKQFAVTAVGTGKDAMTAVTVDDPDLILLDVQLGKGESGLDVCRELRTLGHQTTVIFLTGLCNEQDKQAGLAVGANGYLTKPFSPLELIASINAVLKAKS